MTEQLREFFEKYAESYDRFDPNGAAAFITCPLVTVRAGEVTVYDSPKKILLDLKLKSESDERGQRDLYRHRSEIKGTWRGFLPTSPISADIGVVEFKVS